MDSDRVYLDVPELSAELCDFRRQEVEDLIDYAGSVLRSRPRPQHDISIA